jgi:murein tripeptide amidase MpaA
MTDICFDHYADYDELTRALMRCAKAYPRLVRVWSICTTPKGREVWAVCLTNRDTGEDRDKPACYLDANHHAGEVVGSMAALFTVLALARRYGEDENVTRLLDQSAAYILPRVSPDGAQVYLNAPDKLRSVDRPYPFETRAPGLHPMDIDGDGVIRLMRIPSPAGAWKACETDARLMRKRAPGEGGGAYFHVFPEGEIEGYDGLHIAMAPDKWGLDFNRNFPFAWRGEGEQPGAGPYPLSCPEVKAVADFIRAHPNIACATTLHSSGGVVAYPPGTKPEAEADKRDMRMCREIGAMLEGESGYPLLNIFDGFLPDASAHDAGAFDDYLYQGQGILAFTVELWDILRRAGVLDIWPARAVPKTDARREACHRRVLDWLEANLGSAAVKPWTPFDHPQLGMVEIGGYDFKFTVQNCPPAYLAQEVEKAARMFERVMGVLPRVAIRSLAALKVGDGLYRVEAVVANDGYLPTFITQQALNLKADKPPTATLSFEGEVVAGSAHEAIGHLEGVSSFDTHYAYDAITTASSQPLQKRLIWIVRAKAGTMATLTLRSDKIGVITQKVLF